MAINTSSRLLGQGTELHLRHADTDEERTVRHRMRGMRGWKLLEDRYGSIESAMTAVTNLTRPARVSDLPAVIALVARAIVRRAADLGEASRVLLCDVRSDDLVRLAVAGITSEFGRQDQPDSGARQAEALAIATMICQDHLLSLGEKKRVDDLCILLAAGLQGYRRDLTPITDSRDDRVLPEDMIDWIDLEQVKRYGEAVVQSIQESSGEAEPDKPDGAERRTGPVDAEVAWAEAQARADAGGQEGNAARATAAPESDTNPTSPGPAGTTSPPSSTTDPTMSSGTA